MANRIFPNWEQLKSMHNKLTPGEEALLLYLDKYLPKDDKWTEKDKLENYNGWLIFAQPFLNGSRPDIVIFNPNVGAVIYEVKDWNLKNYEWKLGKTGSKSLFVNDSKGSYPVKEPQNQVLHYKNKIIGELVSIIGEQVDKNQKNFGLVKIALYFHNENTQTVKSFFQDKIKNFNYCPVFGYDSLEEIQLGYIVPNVKFTKSKYWDRNWNNDIIFWLKPPFHSIEQGTLLKLKYNQIKIAEPRPGHHRVRGIAGSGKTQALAYRAGKLAEMGLNVLILTFNITLWHYIRDMIARAPFKFYWDKSRSIIFTVFAKIF